MIDYIDRMVAEREVEYLDSLHLEERLKEQRKWGYDHKILLSDLRRLALEDLSTDDPIASLQHARLFIQLTS